MRNSTTCLLWAPAGLLLSACAAPPLSPEYNGHRVERMLINHSVQIDAGEPLVLSLPQRNIRVTEQALYEVVEYDAQGTPLDQTESYQTLPWAAKPVDVIAGDFQTSLLTDNDGLLRLNLLDDGFIELDYDSLRVIQLSASASPTTRSEVNLLISRELRGKLHEAVALIYDNLEQDEVEQWAYRVHRLAELGLEEESNQLENMLILLTTGDPELQGDFIQALGTENRP